MSRVANKPVVLPKGVTVAISDRKMTVQGSKGKLEHTIHDSVNVKQEDNVLTFEMAEESKQSHSMAGTTRALVSNMVQGVDQGFEKRLTLIGVGYRAQAKGKVLNLTLGYSHPIDYAVPEGIEVETPSQTEVVVRGTDKQKVGQAAADIRAYRPPEPYKGKGVRYSDEVVVKKEAKKK
ncbi:MAG: 50S ribosomal protein L6 [Gammaproteobacteria bacterium]|nr:50S ribosomal protein L6 [Gammaproteobacteria bacterium]